MRISSFIIQPVIIKAFNGAFCIMKNYFLLFILSVSILLSLPDQFNSAYAKTGKRPKVGVVLSGGGAKGFAHIAVLRKIEELNIPVDYIAGTSMGSIIAGLYAMGYTPDEIEDIAVNSDWNRYFADLPDRSNVSLLQKIFFDGYSFQLNVSEDGIHAPRGLVNGQKTGMFLSRLTWGAQHIKNYNDLPIPFFCIGTDFESGTGTILDSGILAQSLRASMAIPSVFDPVEINGRVYLDGGVVNNFPVKELKDKGADIIIGVDVSSRLYKKKDLTSAPKIMEQAVSFLGDAKTLEQRKLCDILIVPDVTKFAALDFDMTSEIIKEGETATLLQIDKLKKLSVRMSRFRIEKRAGPVLTDENSRIKIDEINYHNLQLVSESIINQFLNIEPGQEVSAQDVEKSVNFIYGLNYFEIIHYNIDKDGGRNVLNLYFEEKTESRLNFGISIDSDFNAGLLAGFEIRNLLFKNTETIFKGRFGEYSKFDFTYLVYTPFDPGVCLDINTNIYNMDFILYEEGKKYAIYEFWYSSYSAGLNSFYSNWLLLSFNVRKEYYDVNADIASDYGEASYEFDVTAFSAVLTVDTLDKRYFAGNGLFLKAEFDTVKTNEAVYTDAQMENWFQRSLINFMFAMPIWNNFAYHLGGAASTVSSAGSPPTYWLALGGAQYYENWIFPLNGYDLMEETGQHGWVYYIDLQYEFISNFFISLKWNEGKVSEDYDETFKYRDTFSAYGLSLGYLSPVGPIEVSLFRKTFKNEFAFHFSLGILF
jgi:NTE family protein